MDANRPDAAKDAPSARPADDSARPAPPPPRPRSPFATVAPAAVFAALYAVLIMVWVVVGDQLPGGRWLAVHMFTLGVLTNVVLAFSQHFGRTVTRATDEPWSWQTAAANAAVVLVLVGIPSGMRWATTIGATAVTAVVFDNYLRIRRMRKRSVGARFAWIARMYERAHGSFTHGAVLGFLLGVGLLPGTWYAAGRLAHLHVNVLGWGGLTLLATLVFFGPTVVRARIEEGADARAATALRRGASGLTVGVLLLLASGAPGTVGTVLRLLAAAGLAVYAWSVVVVCLPVRRVAWRAKPSATRLPIAAVAVWFPLVAWADVIVVASGQFRLLDPLGVAALAGVLTQAIATALMYVAPMLRGTTKTARDRILARYERGAVAQAVLFNLGVVALTVAAAAGTTLGTAGAVLAWSGWGVVLLTLLSLIVRAAWPVPRTAQEA